MTTAMKPFVDQMENLRKQVQQYKPPQRSRLKLDWDKDRNKRPYCIKGEECYRQNNDGPDCYWRHAGHLRCSVPLALSIETAEVNAVDHPSSLWRRLFSIRPGLRAFCGLGPGPPSRVPA